MTDLTKLLPLCYYLRNQKTIFTSGKAKTDTTTGLTSLLPSCCDFYDRKNNFYKRKIEDRYIQPDWYSYYPYTMIFKNKNTKIYIWYSCYPCIAIFVIKKAKTVKDILVKKFLDAGIPTVSTPTTDTSTVTFSILWFL